MAVTSPRPNSVGHGPCVKCGRKMRPANWLLSDSPETVPHYRKGVCAGCHKREQRRINPGAYSPKPPKNCVGCGRKLRPGKTKPADYPGTVEHRGKGRCQMCAKQATNPAAPPKPAPVRYPIDKPAPTGIDPAHDAYLRRRRERIARTERAKQLRKRLAA